MQQLWPCIQTPAVSTVRRLLLLQRTVEYVSIDRKRVRTILTWFRTPERHTINSNSKTTTTRNTWSLQQRSSNGLANDILDLLYCDGRGC